MPQLSLLKPVRTAALAATAAFALAAPLANPAAAAFKPVDGGRLLSKTGLKIHDFPLPGGKLGYLIHTGRTPVLITGGRQIVLIMTYNGVDDAKWPYPRLLGRVLKAACGLDGAAAARLVTAAYKSKSVIPPRRLGGNGGTLVKRRRTVVLNGCRITVEIDGPRWHRLTTTIRKA